MFISVIGQTGESRLFFNFILTDSSYAITPYAQITVALSSLVNNEVVL